MTNNNQEQKWEIFKGEGDPHSNWKLPPSPSWRPFGKDSKPGESRRKKRGENFHVCEEEVRRMINAALYLRRPLLVTGKPGTGKSSLVYAVARELVLGEVLYWPITTRTTLKDGLYSYDAIGRLQEAKQQEELNRGSSGKLTKEERQEQIRKIEKYITLGPLGTALLESEKPRVLLIDEIDKSDIDLPNDLLTVFEEGRFEIPELVRIKDDVPEVTVRTAYKDKTEDITKQDLEAEISEGQVTCNTFPCVILPSNGEREFPAPFLRRCLRLTMQQPGKKDLEKIVEAHFGDKLPDDLDSLLTQFIKNRESKTLATDQLLNAVFMVIHGKGKINHKHELVDALMADLGSVEEG